MPLNVDDLQAVHHTKERDRRREYWLAEEEDRRIREEEARRTETLVEQARGDMLFALRTMPVRGPKCHSMTCVRPTVRGGYCEVHLAEELEKLQGEAERFEARARQIRTRILTPPLVMPDPPPIERPTAWEQILRDEPV
jgi:hypothetical protein